jgi:hypothetical protein
VKEAWRLKPFKLRLTVIETPKVNVIIVAADAAV